MARPARFRWQLAAVVFAAVLLTIAARWPLAWTARWLPASVRCEAPAGSLWNGRCTALSIGDSQLGVTSWRLHPWRLLHGSLAVAIQANQGVDFVRADVELRLGGRRDARNVEARLQLGEGILRQGSMGLRGSLHATFAHIALLDRVVRDAVGTVTVRQLTQTTGQRTLLGDYELTFADGPATGADEADVKGALRDLGGPLGVTGSLTFTAEPGYLIDGFVVTRPETPAALARQIAVLGTPDAAGRRPFSLAGTY